MAYFDVQQPQYQAPWSNPLIGGMLNPQVAQSLGQLFAGPMQGSGAGFASGLGQAAYGQPLGQFGYGQQPYIGAFGQGAFGGAFGQGWGMQPNMQSPWAQRALSPQDVGEVVRQMVPILPQIIAQAQQPQSMGYAAYGLPQRQLTPQDVNEVVRHLLPIVPQIIGLLQGQPQVQQAAMYGSFGGGLGGGLGQLGPFGYAQGHQPGAQINPLWQQQQPFGQLGWPTAQAAFGQAGFGNQGPWGQWGQRQLSQQDATEVARQLVGLIPQVIGNLQALNQQRMI